MTRLVLLVLLTGAAVPLAAQGYRVRLDARGQSVTWRGLTLDSIPLGDAAPGPTGGFVSPDGYAVHCSTAQWCFFFRPGPDRRGVPLSATASLVAWGFGIDGLTLHATGRLVTDAGGDDVWPATEPTAQLLEGYAEYARHWFTGRAGRLILASRLESIGFDGAWVRGRWGGPNVELVGYGGWGLGQAAVVPVTSPLLNPLDEWRPARRQLVAGGEVAWLPGPVDLRAEYRREVDPELDYFVSERAAASFRTRPIRSLMATGGFDYNIAEGVLGSADLTLTWLADRVTASAGGRRYRPYFSLWTLWGAFSPVPYHAVHGSVQLRPRVWLSLRGRGERYWYDAAEVSTALVRVEDNGWRVSMGASVTPTSRWTLDGSYLLEYGPGAAARSFDATVGYQPTPAVQVAAYGGRLSRPLEFRFYDATTTWLGGRAEWQFLPRMRAWADGAWFRDTRDRPDPAATDWDQIRLRGGVTVTFGTNADRLAGLPPARRTEP